VGLAYWLQDDGGHNGVGGFQINTNSYSYTKEQVELLILVLKKILILMVNYIN
jgi:hypothetical protein